MERKQIPLWERSYLSIKEAMKYFNLGENKIRELSNLPDSHFVIFIGNKKLINRKLLEKFINCKSTI